jgi:ABC-type phosphate transport system substrate-binding protein
MIIDAPPMACRLIALAVSLVVAFSGDGTCAESAGGVCGDVQWAYSAVCDLAVGQEPDRSRPARPINLLTAERIVELFLSGHSSYDVFFRRSPPAAAEAAALAKRWPTEVAQPKIFQVGQVRIAVAVNKNNPVRGLTVGQIRDMLRVEGAGKDWRELGGGAGAINPYGEGEFATSRLVIRQACMIVGDDQPGWHYIFRPEFEMLEGADAVIEKLRTDRCGIGFFLYSGQELPPHVKLLAVAKSADDAPVALETGTVIQDNYPLAEYLVLYLRLDASAAPREFCEFAMSPAGAEIAKRHGLTTPGQNAEAADEKRVAEAKAGHGIKVQAAGLTALRGLLPDLALEYVRAQQTIQVAYAGSDSESTAIGGFLSDRPNRPELLFLNGPPQGKALGVHGARWKEVDPTGHLLAGRATAIIVNAANKLDALSRDQIEGVLSGAIDDWALIEGTGLTAPERRLPGTRNADAIPVNRLGLRKNDPAAELLQRTRPAKAKLGRMTHLAGTAEVVAAVGIDPYAIGIVDLAAMPTTGQTIKVLGIAVDAEAEGEKARIVRPTAETIRDGTYPFAERVYVYAHPEASDAAKRFAEFLRRGGDADTPKNDAMKHVYENHGLVPLETDERQVPPPSEGDS